MNEIEAKRKELEKGCNANSALFDVNCGQQYEQNYDIYYCNRCENKLNGFNLGVEMGDKQGYERARKEILELIIKIDGEPSYTYQDCWKELKRSLDSPRNTIEESMPRSVTSQDVVIAQKKLGDVSGNGDSLKVKESLEEKHEKKL